MVTLNRSLPVDRRLWAQDIRASQAWAQALVGAQVISREEGEALVAGLDSVALRFAQDGVPEGPEEDIHTLVERFLEKEVGALAGKLHTGRSRNDQVATDFRLWGMEWGRELEKATREVQEGLIVLAEQGMDILLPGYTHLQPAQPLRGAQWALSHFWPLQRDRERIIGGTERAGVLPLGSGALAGCPFPVDREELRKSLGFTRVSENSLDAVSDRDWAVELTFAGSLLGIHLSRLAEDLVLFSTREFGFLRLSDGFSTGSSLMPQKRNPDVAELVRGKSGRLAGNLTAFLTLLKGLPTGYNRDLQEDKAILFDTVDTLLLVLPPLAQALREATFQEGKITAALSTEMLATEVADYLVKKGIPFREAHHVVGQVVREAEEAGCVLPDLPLERFQRLHPAFQADVFQLFSWEAAVEARSVPGGTAREAVLTQLAAARRMVDSVERPA